MVAAAIDDDLLGKSGWHGFAEDAKRRAYMIA